jgi:hypothetical protein
LGTLDRVRHDSPTTLRNYAHALPLEDQSVADDIDEMLSAPSDRDTEAPKS